MRIPDKTGKNKNTYLVRGEAKSDSNMNGQARNLAQLDSSLNLCFCKFKGNENCNDELSYQPLTAWRMGVFMQPGN